MSHPSIPFSDGRKRDQDVSIMLVEDNDGDALLFQEMLAPIAFRVVHFKRLDAALEALSQQSFDVVLLDLGLPDSQGLETVRRASKHMIKAPVIVVLTGNEDVKLALDAVREGAQDYLTKDRLDTELLSRAIRYALERHNLQIELERVRQEAESARQRDFYAALTDVPDLGDAQLAPDESQLYELHVAYAQIAFDFLKHCRNGKPRPREAVREFAMRTASLRLKARHIVKFHLDVLESLERGSPEPSLVSLTNDLRLLLVEVLGNLADIYLSVYRVMQPSEHRK